MTPRFLALDHALRLHSSLIETYGGTEGLRDAGLLEAAIAMPMASYDGEFLHTNLFEMAAAYLFHISQNHPFLDGNKRTAAACALVFLTMNGIVVDNDEDGLVDISLRTANGEAEKTEIATFFRSIALPSEA